MSTISDFEFDSPFTVDANGNATRADGIYGPERVQHDETEDMLIDERPYRSHPKWEALTGHTNQYSYNGPVMHTSEYVGGGLARYITETPGTYVYVTVEVDDDPDNPSGWAILRLKEEAQS